MFISLLIAKVVPRLLSAEDSEEHTQSAAEIGYGVVHCSQLRTEAVLWRAKHCSLLIDLLAGYLIDKKDATFAGDRI